MPMFGLCFTGRDREGEGKPGEVAENSEQDALQ